MKRSLYFLIIVVLLSNCKAEVDHEDQHQTQRANRIIDPELPQKVMNVGFVIVDGVYNSELVAPMDIFHHTVFHTEFGMKVFTVAPSKEVITTFEGLRILPDFSFSDPGLPEINVLVVPSAEKSMTSDLENEELIEFVKTKGAAASYIMSLCDGAFVLAKAGLVYGHVSTTFPSDIEKYRIMFPELDVRENVSFVHDRKMITSAGGAKSYDPALYLSELLYGKKAADGIAAGLVIDWDLSQMEAIIP